MTLDETGYLHCAYLGTDPSMMVTPAPEARDINYEVSVAYYNVFFVVVVLEQKFIGHRAFGRSRLLRELLGHVDQQTLDK